MFELRFPDGNQNYKLYFKVMSLFLKRSFSFINELTNEIQHHSLVLCCVTCLCTCTLCLNKVQ